MSMKTLPRFCALLLGVSALTAAAGVIKVAGTVPDDATKAAIIARLQAVYGTEHTIDDQLKVGGVVTPPEWSNTVQKLISPNLKTVTAGQLSVNGANITLRGNVGSDEQRKTVTDEAGKAYANAANVYSLKTDLRVVADPGQGQDLLNQTLANRIIEFESGSSTLAPSGQGILDEMAVALNKIGRRTVLIIGHTDASGNQNANIALSKARADAVKAYLSSKGIDPATLLTEGMGPAQPVAPNTTEEGRRRNRRIEFKIPQT